MWIKICIVFSDFLFDLQGLVPFYKKNQVFSSDRSLECGNGRQTVSYVKGPWCSLDQNGLNVWCQQNNNQYTTIY